MDTFSMSNSLSKGSVYESDSIYKAYLDDAQSRLADGVRPEAISNEEIHKGDPILETYRVEDDAIHGGMGSVWRVHHESWDTDLAMKRPQPRFFSEGSEQRKAEFVAECEHWINLGLHPNIVSCYYVRDIGGVPTIFSEWMDGGSLKDAIQSGRLYEGTEEEVQTRILDIAIQTARGLQYSHEQGLIHQDVKPGNILLTRDLDAKVADFGLAKARSQLTDGEKPASSGYTLAYCPREQAEGARAEAWMDVYAWALTVLEMYAGQRNWSRGTEAAEHIESLLGLCRVPVSVGMCSLLSGAVNRAYSGFARILEQLEQVFIEVTGRPFDRPLLQAAPDTADSMNNRALSYLDLEKTEDAVRLWEAAIHTDNSNFRCHYNLAVTLWKANRISASELRQRIESHREDSPLYNQAEADTRFAQCRSASDVRRDIQTSGIEEPLPQEPFHDVNRFRQGEKRPGYFTDPYECPLSRGDLYMDESLDGERRIGVDAAGKRYFLEDGQRSKSFYRTYLQDREYMADRNNLSVKRFVDPYGEIVVDNHSAYAVEFFNARTGRSLLSYPLKKDSEGDEILETVQRYTENGYVYIAEFSRPGWWLKLPLADPQLTFSLSRIASFSQRSEAMKRLLHVLPEAEAAFARGDYETAHGALAPYCEDGTLLLCDPALVLWEKLFPFYEPGRLMTVLPTAPCSQRDGRWHAGEGNREEPAGPYTENDASDGRTVLTSTYTYYTYENHNNGMDVDIFYSVSASDAASGRPFYTLSFKNSESDDHVFSYSQWFKLCGQYLWLKSPEDARPTRIDLADIGVQQRMSLCMALPGGYELQNKDGHVRIGEYEYEDTYEGLNLLSDEQVIRCARHAYRLIYRYNGLRSAGEPRENASTPASMVALPVTGQALDGGETEERRNMASSSLSIDNTLTKDSVYESDSIYKAYLEDAASRLADGVRPEAISNEEIHKGDSILETYRVESDAIHGGMGSVWRVHHQGWNVNLAMKRPQPRFFAEGSERRKVEFVAECEHWINLGLHPNIVSCYYVRDIGGVPSIFSEWMDGGSLKDAIQSGRLYRETGLRSRQLDIAIQSARGLRYSHENGLLHQDVKPGNLLLTRKWEVKVADFGLAKGKTQLSEGTVPTQTSGYTVAYCPGEQAEGGVPEAWMDVYAWALTMLEMFLRERRWEKGADVPRVYDALCAGCRCFPKGMKKLLKACLLGKVRDFMQVEARLLEIYRETVAEEYPRPQPDAAADNAASLNNRALSFLDLGKPDEAQALWEAALNRDVSDFYCRYNCAVFLWKRRRIEYEELRDRVMEYTPRTEEQARLIAAVVDIAGDPEEDRGYDYYRNHEIWYTQVKPVEAKDSMYFDFRHPEPDVDTEGGFSLMRWDPQAPEGKRPAWTARRGQDGGIVLENGSESVLLPGIELLDLSADGNMALFTDADNRVRVMDLRTQIMTGATFGGGKRFASMDGGVLADIFGALDLFDSFSGCKLGHRLYPNEPGWFDQGGDFIGFVLPNGPILYQPKHRWVWETIPMPKSGVSLPYIVAQIRTYDEIRREEAALKADVPAARAALEAENPQHARELLEPYCRYGALFEDEEALRLWTSLGEYYENTEILAVVPTDDPPVPDPADYAPDGMDHDPHRKNWGSNGVVLVQTQVARLQEHEGYTGDLYADIEWSLTGYDAKSPDKKVFFIPLLDAETQRDEEEWYTTLTPSFTKDGRMHWPVSQMHGTSKGIDGIALGEPKLQRQLNMCFFLPGGAELRNTEEGLVIGHTRFDDEFEGCYPLYNARIIPGKKRNYRIVSRYGAPLGPRPGTSVPSGNEGAVSRSAAGDVSLSNTLSKGSAFESDSILNAYRIDPSSQIIGGLERVSISNEQICRGDVILQTYRVESDAIHGGMGSVWRVHHGGWNIDLAMKRPQPRFFAEGSERRKAEFVAECEHWINLGLHPNIVSCYYVRDIGGVPSIFSEWMDGGSLKDAIQSDRLYAGTEEEVQARILDIAIQTARGLAYSHEQGLIHQDVKPGNILLTRDWDAKVADFGLAKAQSRLSDGEKTLSSGYTLAYCPREQAEGAAAEKWMDVYAWALTVIEMYSGKRTWSQGNEVRGRLGEILEIGRVQVPAGVRNLLDDAIHRAYSGFGRLLERLEQVYGKVCGTACGRPAPSAAADTSDSLNNRALSYLDLGKPDEARRLWQRALRADATGFYARYNYELWRWKQGEISDIAFHDAIFRLGVTCDAAALARARISLCRREDIREAERCLEALGQRRSVAPDIREGLNRSLAAWQRILQALPQLPADLFSEASKQAEAMFLPAESFSEAFPGLVAKKGAPLQILEADTGRIMRQMDVRTAFNTGDEAEEWLQGYTPEGGALLHADYHFRRCIALPDPDIAFSYEPAVVENYRQRRLAEEQAARDHARAMDAWKAGRVAQSARILEGSLKRGTLVLHEPSMELWTALGRHFPKKALAAAVETQASASPLPPVSPDPARVCQLEGDVFNQGWACVSCDGITELKLGCSRLVARENLNNNTDAEFTYCVTATDVATGQTVFRIDPFFSRFEDDDTGPFSRYQIRMETPGRLILWSQYEEPRECDILDMPGAGVSIALPGGCELRNTSEGVEIGGVLYADRFADYRPLFDAEIIPCRNHNYRLIYEYDLSAAPLDSDAETSASAPETPGDKNTGTPADASASFPGSVPWTPLPETEEATSPAFHMGDVLEGGYEVLDDAVPGGMNRVWHVRHADTGAELAMVQPLRPGPNEAGSPALRRFADAHALWQGIAAHPNVAVCHNVRTLNGIPTAFCEWVDGESLSESIRGGSLYEGPAEEVESRLFDIARQAALALRHVHGQGLIHCDVKPGNLLISRGCVVRLYDFGLAMSCTKQGEAERNERASGYTPAYCPAEQAEGKQAKPWMDVYAWALTVLEMYLGERPWSSGAEAKEDFDGYLPACRVPLPEGMVTLLRCCLKWKVNDGSVVVRELERMKPASAGESKKTASDAAQQAPRPGAGGPAPSKAAQPAEQRNGDSNESKALSSGLRGFLSRLIFGKKSGCRKGQHDWDGCVCRNCGLERHNFRIAKEAVVQEPGPCCWSSNDDCIGPDCGTPCDAYYPGREGKKITTWRCARCGLERTEE